jgi:hypothetical protein
MLHALAESLFDKKPIRLGELYGTVRYRLGHGASDAEQITQTLSRLIFEYGTDPKIRRFTTQWLDGCDHDDRQGQIRAITGFMSDHVRYVRDPMGVEYVRAPTRMIEEYEKFGMANGDCDDQVLLSGSMFYSIGFDCRPVGLNLHTSEYFDHVALQLKSDKGDPITYDPCRPSDPFQQPKTRYLAAPWASSTAG